MWHIYQAKFIKHLIYDKDYIINDIPFTASEALEA